MSVCMSVCVCLYLSPFVCLSVCMSVHLSVSTSVYLSVCLNVFLNICLCVCVFVRLSVYLSECLHKNLSICLCVCVRPSVCHSVCLSMCLPGSDYCLSSQTRASAWGYVHWAEGQISSSKMDGAREIGAKRLRPAGIDQNYDWRLQTSRWMRRLRCNVIRVEV